jgi:hypothetical protein
MTTYSLALLIYGLTMSLGLLVFAILCGAIYRHIMSMARKIIYGLSSMDEFNVLLRFALFCKGFMRIIVSLCIILLKISKKMSLLPQVLLLVLLVLKIVGDGFNDVVY